MSQKKPGNKKINDYRAVGYAFLAISAAMFISESTRSAAITFFVIGIVFVVMKADNDSTGDDSSKKQK